MMGIEKHIVDGKLIIRVIPGASKTQIRGESDGVLKIALNAPAREGEANKELIKFLKKQGIKARIIEGFKSRDKVLEVTL